MDIRNMISRARDDPWRRGGLAAASGLAGVASADPVLRKRRRPGRA